MLIEREYSPRIIDGAVAKARAVPRIEALRKVPRTPPITNRPTFVVMFDPWLPSISQITKKHWRSMVGQEPYLQSVFPEPQLVAYRRQKNIKESIIRAKVAPARQQRTKKRLHKYVKCLACSYVKEGKLSKSKDYTGKTFVENRKTSFMS